MVAVRMAIITGRTFVDISGDFVMLVVHILLIMLMTEDAFEDFIIIGINVTIGAKVPFTLMTAGIYGKILVIVIPGGLLPVSGIMTIIARGRETGSLVIGIGRVIVVVLVAGKTGGRRIVVPGGMARQTIQPQVSAGQRKLRLAMIKRCGLPRGGIVAFCAIVAIIPGYMIRIVDVIIIVLVATPAICRRTGITVGIAVDTLQRRVRAGKRKLGLAMIENRRAPAIGGMTDGTIVVEIILRVVRVRDSIVIVLVAVPAICRSAGITVGMAVDTLQ